MLMESAIVLLGAGILGFGVYRFLGDEENVQNGSPGQIIEEEKRMPVRYMQISPEGVAFIKLKEGFESYPYKDSAGTWTIGYGTTKGISGATTPISIQEGERLLRSDLAKFHRELSALVKVPLKQSEYDALMSFIYNLGATNLSSSELLEKLNAGDYEGAANEFPRWVWAGGQKISGLIKRRNEEKQIFLS